MRKRTMNHLVICRMLTDPRIKAAAINERREQKMTRTKSFCDAINVFHYAVIAALIIEVWN